MFKINTARKKHLILIYFKA